MQLDAGRPPRKILAAAPVLRGPTLRPALLAACAVVAFLALLVASRGRLAHSHLQLSNILWFFPPDHLLEDRLLGVPRVVLAFCGWAALLFVPMLALGLLGRRLASLRPQLLALGVALFPIYGLLFPLLGHGGDPSHELLEYVRASGPGYKAGETLGTLPFYLLSRPLHATRLSELEFSRVLALGGLLGAAGLWCLAMQVSCGGWSWRQRQGLRRDTARWFVACAIAFQPIGIMLAGFIQTTVILCILAPWAVWAFVAAFTRRPAVGVAIVAIGLAWVAYYAHGVAVTLLLPIALGLAGLGVRGLHSRTWSTVLLAGSLLLWAITVPSILAALIELPVSALDLKGKVDPWSRGFESLPAAIRGLQTISHQWPAWMPLANPQLACGQQTRLFTLPWALFALGALAHVGNLPAVILWMKAGALRRLDNDANIFAVPAIAVAAGLIEMYSPHYSYPKDLDVILFPGLLLSTAALAGLGRARAVGSEVAVDIRLGRYGALLCAAWSALATAGLWALQFTYVNDSFTRGISSIVCG